MKRCLGILLALFAVQAHGASLPVNEYQQFTLTAPTTVEYGNGLLTTKKTFAAGTWWCANDSFKSDTLPSGDPAVNLAKTCKPVATQTFECFPDMVLPLKAKVLSVSAGEFEGWSVIAAWSCNTPTGIVNYQGGSSLGDVWEWSVSWSLKLFDEAKAKAWCAANCKPPTQNQLARMKPLLDPYAAVVKVSTNGATLTRPVFTIDAAGVRKEVAGAKVQVGAVGNLNKRVGSYCSVEGQPNVAVAGSYPKLGNVYALCTLTTPVGVND